jgi:hypothetical protein
MSSPLPRALPWASAAGVAVLVAGVVAGQLGAGADDSPTASMASAAAPAAPAAPEAAAPEVVEDMPEAGVSGTEEEAAATTEVTESDVTVVPASVARALDTATEHLGALRKAPAERAAKGFSFLVAGYSATLSSAALVPVKSAAPAGVGYSAVTLTKKPAVATGACDIVGAGYWLSDPVERAYRNPTASRAHQSAAATTSTPAVYTGPGVRWDAACASDTSGRAVANTAEVAQAEGMGSTVSASVDRRTGTYVGTARSYVVGVRTPSGVLDSVTSLVQVKVADGAEPLVTYRVKLVDGSRTVTLAGTDVPADRLGEQFGQQTAAKSAGVEAFAAKGVQVVLPQGSAHTLTAPLVLAGSAAIGEARFTGRFS